MKDKLRDMRESLSGLKEEVEELREDVPDLRRENEDLKTDNEGVKKRVETTEHKTDDLECRSTRNNLILYGIPRIENETWQECEEEVQEMFTDKLELSVDRVHRLNAKPDSLIIARCLHGQRNKNESNEENEGQHCVHGEDCSQRVREI